jgi:hypothetical protein
MDSELMVMGMLYEKKQTVAFYAFYKWIFVQEIYFSCMKVVNM